MADITQAMKMFMLLGELDNKTKSDEDKVKYKERIVFATMKNQIPDWQKPKDWETLTAKEKLKRLDKIQNI